MLMMTKIAQFGANLEIELQQFRQSYQLVAYDDRLDEVLLAMKRVQAALRLAEIGVEAMAIVLTGEEHPFEEIDGATVVAQIESEDTI